MASFPPASENVKARGKGKSFGHLRSESSHVDARFFHVVLATPSLKSHGRREVKSLKRGPSPRLKVQRGIEKTACDFCARCRPSYSQSELRSGHNWNSRRKNGR